MPRITPLTGRRAGTLARLIQKIARRRGGGHDFTPISIAAHAPPMLLPYAGMSGFAQGKTKVDPRVRALAMHLAGHVNRCEWCMDYGAHVAQTLGVPDDKILDVEEFRTSPAYTDAERAALAFAWEMTQVGCRVSDETFAELRRHFGEREVVELAFAVAAENFFNRMNAAFQLEAEGFCAVPPRRRAAAAQ
ncbi:MAG TPA: carboxymuconolactone decarboxylase family protein [Longimicrobium sp.]|nr:carboxymuconolactone decarboxylase family protein [Longimicrobium sp.]